MNEKGCADMKNNEIFYKTTKKEFNSIFNNIKNSRELLEYEDDINSIPLNKMFILMENFEHTDFVFSDCFFVQNEDYMDEGYKYAIMSFLFVPSNTEYDVGVVIDDENNQINFKIPIEKF